MIELDPKFQELMKSRKPNALLTDFVKRQMFVEQEQLNILLKISLNLSLQKNKPMTRNIGSARDMKYCVDI